MVRVISFLIDASVDDGVLPAMTGMLNRARAIKAIERMILFTGFVFRLRCKIASVMFLL